MYLFLLKTHSGFRYVVFALLIFSLLQSVWGWMGKRMYTEGNRKLNLFTLISAHIQLLLGLILYFVSPFVQFGGDTMKNSTLRYWTVEHLAMMVLAIVLITIGHSRSKKIVDAVVKHRTIFFYYGLAFIIIIATVIQSGRPLIGS